MSFPEILIGSKLDAKGFKEAETAINKLEKGVKSLAGAFGIAFSTRAVVNFSRAAVKAFADDNAAIALLSKNLENLGLSYQNVNAENFINKLQEQSGIIDDLLRPAYAQLAKVTLSTTKTQDLMALAVDVARANGLQYLDVINTLSRAYVGNYKGLKNLNTGLTDAQLKTKSFAEIQKILIQQSQGAGKAYIETFAGSIDKLSIAATNAKEVLGEGLVDLFADMAGNGDIDKATANVNKFATAVSDLLKDVSEYNLLDFVSAFVTGNVTESTAQKLVKRSSARRFFTGGSGVSTELLTARKLAAAEAARIKAEKAAAAAKLAADKKASAAKIAADKKAADNAAKLSKAGAMFDLDKIQIEAALKGKITDEETLRLQLQRAILNEDATLADELQKRLEASQRATAALQGQISGIRPPVDPFAETLKSLENIAELLGKLGGMSFGKPGGGVLALEPDDFIQLGTKPGVTPKPTPTPTITEPVPVVVIPSPTPLPATNGSMAGLGGTAGTGTFGFSVPGYTYVPPSLTVNVTVEGSVLTENDFVDVVNKAVITANTNGLNNSRPGSLTVTE